MGKRKKKMAEEAANAENARCYDMSKMTAQEVMEDFFAAEEDAALQEKLAEGWVEVGIYDPNAPDAEEQWEAIAEKLLDMME